MLCTVLLDIAKLGVLFANSGVVDCSITIKIDCSSKIKYFCKAKQYHYVLWVFHLKISPGAGLIYYFALQIHTQEQYGWGNFSKFCRSGKWEWGGGVAVF